MKYNLKLKNMEAIIPALCFVAGYAVGRITSKDEKAIDERSNIIGGIIILFVVASMGYVIYTSFHALLNNSRP